MIFKIVPKKDEKRYNDSRVALVCQNGEVNEMYVRSETGNENMISFSQWLALRFESAYKLK